MVPSEHLAGYFSLPFFLVRVTEHIRSENSLHNQKTQKPDNIRAWQAKAYFQNITFLTLNQLFIFFRKSCLIYFFKILPVFDEFVYCFYRIVIKFIIISRSSKALTAPFIAWYLIMSSLYFLKYCTNDLATFTFSFEQLWRQVLVWQVKKKKLSRAW